MEKLLTSAFVVLVIGSLTGVIISLVVTLPLEVIGYSFSHNHTMVCCLIVGYIYAGRKEVMNDW
jgi:hypothetical protein